jgi:hypothetical protein
MSSDRKDWGQKLNSLWTLEKLAAIVEAFFLFFFCYLFNLVMERA